MTLQELDALLKTTGLPVTYRAWPNQAAPPLPWLCYLAAYSDNFGADGRVYFPINRYQIELYTSTKEPDIEAKVEDALASLYWDKTETYLESEHCYQILYEIEV